MSPRDAICCGLTAITEDETTHEAADTMLKQLMVRGFVVVQADRVIQQDGKVCVTRTLVESVLEDAEWWVRSNYVVNGQVHPAMARHFDRDMADILALRAELREETHG